MNSEQPLVCICVPNYNNEATIKETMESLINQTYKNIIIKVFDNASTDNSIAILKEYEKKYKHIKIFQNETNIGMIANMTKCIQNAEGKYTAIFHSDDAYTPQMVEEEVSFLESHKECCAVSTGVFVINEKSEVLKERGLKKEIKSVPFLIIDNEIMFLEELFTQRVVVFTPSLMVKSDIYKDKIQGWNDAYGVFADVDVWLRLAMLEKFAVINKPLMYYRRSNNSYSFESSRNAIDVDNKYMKMYDDYINKYGQFLSKYTINSYLFSLFTDYVLVTINQIIQNRREKRLPIKIFNTKIIRAAFYSSKNFKIYIIGVIVCALRFLPLPEIIRRKIYEIRFSKMARFE
jgi:glycosyltransferase involved in cell wall biosynthesis